MTEKNKGGRPSSYTPEMGARIVERIIDGDSCITIGKDPSFPAERTIYNWIGCNEEFRAMYLEAKSICAERMGEELLEIADDGRNDWMEKNGGGYAVDHEHVGRSKLRVDTRKWLMCHLAPKRFGAKVAQEISGPDGGPVDMTWTVEIVDAKNPNPEED